MTLPPKECLETFLSFTLGQVTPNLQPPLCLPLPHMEGTVLVLGPPGSPKIIFF